MPLASREIGVAHILTNKTKQDRGHKNQRLTLLTVLWPTDLKEIVGFPGQAGAGWGGAVLSGGPWLCLLTSLAYFLPFPRPPPPNEFLLLTHPAQEWRRDKQMREEANGIF